MLQISAFDLERQKGEPNYFHSVVYEKECIRLLRQRLEDPANASCDQTIGPVAYLAALEWARRNLKAMRMHINGLKKMVAVRGGFDQLQSSTKPEAAFIAMWFSLCLTSEVQIPLGDPIVKIQEAPHWLEESKSTSQASQLMDFETYGVLRHVSDILLEIRHLSRYFPTPLNEHPEFVPSCNLIHGKVCSILGRLLQTTSATNLGCRDPLITDCCRLAASIFVLMPFENHFPDPTLLINSLIHKLQTALTSIVSCFTEDGNKLVAWIMFVGGAAAANLPPERDWFVRHLAELVVDLEISSWNDMRKCLKHVLWIDAIDESPFHKLWEEVLDSVTCLTLREPFGAIRY